MDKKFVVHIVEYERGWGSKVDERKFFSTYEAAEDFIEVYNKMYNTEASAPDWYMQAEGPYKLKGI